MPAPIAAVPSYLGKDFNQAAPGHRFHMYLDFWRRTNAGGIEKTDDKARVLARALKLTNNDRRAMSALAERQDMLAGDGTWRLPAVSVAPLTTGLGIEHPLENGFAFLSPYGLPYLPGSGIKGVLRQAARELAEDRDPGWTADYGIDAIDALFGTATDDAGRRGALVFWDAMPVLPSSAEALAPDIMTPHQTHYYAEDQPPHDSGQPNPILFVTIPPGSQFEFYVDCKSALLPSALAHDNRWQDLLRDAFEYAFDWLGFGAKTAVGYGQMAVNAERQQEREEQAREAQARAKEDAQVQQATAHLPADAAEIEAQVQRGGWNDNGAFIDWVEDWLDRLQSERLSPEAWQRVEQAMAHHFDSGILADPDAMKGKKNKPKYSGRKKDIAKRLLTLKPEGDAS